MDTGSVGHGSVFCFAIVNGWQHVHSATTEPAATGSNAGKSDEIPASDIHCDVFVVSGRFGIVLGD